MHRFVSFPLLLSLLVVATIIYTNATLSSDKRPSGEKWGEPVAKTLQVRRTTGPGCPYAAAWLTHVSLFCATGWYMESTKMETHTFNIFRGNTAGYQLVDPFVYSVNHMSMFEHWAHKRRGFGEAVKQSYIMSTAAFEDQCHNPAYMPSESTEFLALIPFYGGLPPNVTAGNLVKSIGQGNSLVNAETKAIQTMAALCSTVKYFGQVVIGVSNFDDRMLMIKMVAKLPASISSRVHIIQFQLNKNANLPFHLLAYGQQFVKHHNCRIFNNTDLMERARFQDVFEICDTEASLAAELEMKKKNKHHRGRVFNQHGNITFYQPSPTYTGARLDLEIRYVYFTEADQIVHFENMDTLYGIASMTNITTFVLPRRREKIFPSPPELYNANLTEGRHCGCEYSTCGCEFTYNAVNRQHMVYQSLAETDINISPDHVYIHCKPPSATEEEKI